MENGITNPEIHKINTAKAVLERVKREHVKAIQFLALSEMAVFEKERLEYLDRAREMSKRVASGITLYFKLTDHEDEYGSLDRSTI